MEVFSFADLFDPGADKPFVVRAKLHLFSSEEGGRIAALKTDYRPNHNFGDADDRKMYIGQIEFVEAEEMLPGETAEVVVRFIPGRGLKENLTVGRRWRIQEGTHCVGEATVLQLISET